MQTLKTVLDGAAGEGIISPEQAGRLAPYLLARGVALQSPGTGAADDLAGGVDRFAGPVEDTEAPRFVRGFHDVLITIGICIAMAGLWGIGSLFASLPAILVLTEVLVKRQRLALPAVVLTLFYCYWIFVIGIAGLDALFGPDLEPVQAALLMSLAFAVMLLPFYGRYRIPLALSLWIAAVSCMLLSGVFLLLMRVTGEPDLITARPMLSSAISLVSALILFGVAMAFDLSDRFRVTRRSDVAFWLHLAAAPALLYAMLAFVFLRDFNSEGVFSAEAGSADAVVVVLIVVVFMAIGLVIDRRAFVTSGLVSLGLATASILQKMKAAPETYIFSTLLIVGLVVLTIGVGWPYFRRLTVSALPPALKHKLPPLR